MNHARNSNRGFTTLELVVVITVIGILSITAYARLSGGDALEARGVRDELASAFRLAQRFAITSGCGTQVTVTSNSYSVAMENSPCGSGSPSYGTTVSSPGSGSLSGSFAGSPISSTGTHTYNAYGDLASGGGTITISIGSDSASFTVQTGSGFVDLP